MQGGTLSVNGSLSSGGLTVNSGATLGGTGTITSAVTVNGTLSPGNSIGEIDITGNVTQASGSTLVIELSPTANDFVNITGSYTIQGNTTLLIEPQPGVYPANLSDDIVHASTGVFGQFTSVVVTLPTFTASVTYDPFDILLVTMSTKPFASVVTTGNAGAVAVCLDTLSAPAGSDQELVLAELRQIPTVEGLADALDLLQPSQFTGLALAEEYATLYTNDTIFQRLHQKTERCPTTKECKVEPARAAPAESKASWSFFRQKPAKPEKVQERQVHKEPKRGGFWVSPFGGLSHQRRTDDQVGFNTGTAGVSAGLDFTPCHWTFGGALGYSHVHLKWMHGMGHSNMQNGYGALYASAEGKYAYLFATGMGGYNHYDASRHIEIGEGSVTEIDRHAKSSHHGWQGSGHFQAGLLFGQKVQFSPFVEADYIYLHENSFSEHGAQSLDLHVEKKNSDFLQGEAGIELSRCFSVSKNKISPELTLSVIREWRFIGKHYKSSFEGSSCVMKTTGMNPDRTIFSGALGFTLLLPDENRTFTFQYQGKLGENFQDNRALVEFLFRF